MANTFQALGIPDKYAVMFRELVKANPHLANHELVRAEAQLSTDALRIITRDPRTGHYEERLLSFDEYLRMQQYAQMAAAAQAAKATPPSYQNKAAAEAAAAEYKRQAMMTKEQYEKERDQFIEKKVTQHRATRTRRAKQLLLLNGEK